MEQYEKWRQFTTGQIVQSIITEIEQGTIIPIPERIEKRLGLESGLFPKEIKELAETILRTYNKRIRPY